MPNLLQSLHRNQDGTTAVEFAIIAPVFIMLILGTIGFCFALFLVGSLHYAVEDGARCASVKTTICTNATSIIAYTQSRECIGRGFRRDDTVCFAIARGSRYFANDRDGALCRANASTLSLARG